MNLIGFYHDDILDRTVYHAIFTHLEYTKDIKEGYFKGYLTEEQLHEKLMEYYNNWIDWLT